MATVTVLMPTFEREALIGDAIRSALDQTFDDLVVLVGDNSTTDATEELIRSIDDPRIRYHRNRPGIGPQNNWLDLIQRADTPLVATLHDDDLWTPEFLSTVVPPMLDDPSIAMTFTDFWLIDQDGNLLPEYTAAESRRSHRDAMPEGTVDYDRAGGLRLVSVWNAPQPAYAAVLRRDHLLDIDFPDEISPLYDIWLSYQLVKMGAGLRYEPQRLTNYRVHLGALTSGGFSGPEDVVFARIIEENRDSGPIVEEITAYWSDLRWARATRLLGEGSDRLDDSQREFVAAAPGLPGLKRIVATIAGRSKLVWKLLVRVREFRKRRPTQQDSRYGNTIGNSRSTTNV